LATTARFRNWNPLLVDYLVAAASTILEVPHSCSSQDVLDTGYIGIVLVTLPVLYDALLSLIKGIVKQLVLDFDEAWIH